MRFWGKTFVVGLIGLGTQNTIFANDDAQISRYEQAKLRLSYDGNVGNLLQQLSQRLKVGFIAYDVDITRKISLQNETETAIKTINEQIESQLTNIDVRFEKIGERLFLVVSAKDVAPLLQNEPKEVQFVGDVIFDGEPNLTEQAQSTAEATKVQNILNIATNQEKIMAAKGKKAPQYKTVTKDNIGLKNIRVTALGTFLVFDTSVDAAKLRVKGNFEDIAQGENIIAILHQNTEAPPKIEIEDSQGKKLILEAHKATSSKKSKKTIILTHGFAVRDIFYR